jgi:large subunit ribosomal protein L4
MATIDIHNLSGEKVGTLDLADEVFGAVHEELLWEAVKHYRASQRSGTHKTKARWEVSGSGKKLWKQKGTGRARIASLRSPLWKGGGNVHGPQPRDWSYQMPRKMRRGALRSALSERLREGNLVIIDELGFKTPKTKDFIGAISGLKLGDGKKPVKLLIVDSLDNKNLVLSSRNVDKTKVVNSFGLNIYDIVYHEKLVLSKVAVEELNELLDPKREGQSEAAPAVEAKPKKAAKATEASTQEAKPKAKKATKEAASVEDIAPLDVSNELPEGDDVLELPAAEEGESK